MTKTLVGGYDDGERPSNNLSQNQKRRRITVEDSVLGSEELAADDEVEEPYTEDDEHYEPNCFGPKSDDNDRDAIDRSISVKLSDPDVLDCCICFEPLSIPVFQCDNGHIACSTCCTNLGKKCAMCLMPIGFNRCRAIEKVLESIKISCLNAKYGCKETLSYSEKNKHEKKCIYVPCSCPHSDCDFLASSNELSIHFSHAHEHGAYSGLQFLCDDSFFVILKSDDECIILQEQNDGNLFILNNNVAYLGHVVNISCIGPPNSSNKPGYHYDILARSQGCSLKLQSFTKNIQRGTAGILSSGFLLIPSDYFGFSERLELEIRIRYRDNATHSAECGRP